MFLFVRVFFFFHVSGFEYSSGGEKEEFDGSENSNILENHSIWGLGKYNGMHLMDKGNMFNIPLYISQYCNNS